MNKRAQSMMLLREIATAIAEGVSNSRHRVARIHKYIAKQTRNMRRHKMNKKHRKNPQFTVR